MSHSQLSWKEIIFSYLYNQTHVVDELLKSSQRSDFKLCADSEGLIRPGRSVFDANFLLETQKTLILH